MRTTLALLALLVAGEAHAACLLVDYSLGAEYSRASAVIIAKAIAERRLPDPEDPEGFAATLYKVRIDESFRGELRGVVELYSENSSGRFPMEMNKKYILFVYASEGYLVADNCGNSGLMDEKASVVTAVRELARKQE